MSILTGQIEIEGIRWGYASAAAPVLAEWRDESVYVQVRPRRQVLVESHHRLAGSFGWDTLSGVDLAQLKALTSKPFAAVLRLQAPGENYPEMEVLLRRTSPIEETGPLDRRVNGAVVYAVRVEFEAVETVPEPIGAIDGGFNLLTQTTVETLFGDVAAYQIEPWGEATMTEHTAEVADGDGGTLVLTYYEVGPEALAALVLRPCPDGDPLCVELDTSGNYRLGTTPRDLRQLS